ncbi:hypothetical protein ILYODFUR_023864, partial [Ilyodon furcidens]
KGSSMPITPIFHSLQWLPVSARIIYKIFLLTFQCLHGLDPAPWEIGPFPAPHLGCRTNRGASTDSTDPDTF